MVRVYGREKLFLLPLMHRCPKLMIHYRVNERSFRVSIRLLHPYESHQELGWEDAELELFWRHNILHVKEYNVEESYTFSLIYRRQFCQRNDEWVVYLLPKSFVRLLQILYPSTVIRAHYAIITAVYVKKVEITLSHKASHIGQRLVLECVGLIQQNTVIALL